MRLLGFMAAMLVGVLAGASLGHAQTGLERERVATVALRNAGPAFEVLEWRR